MNVPNTDAIFIKLGWLEVTAFGHVAIVALVVLASLLLATHLTTRKRRR
jgi:hypothetical protein